APAACLPFGTKTLVPRIRVDLFQIFVKAGPRISQVFQSPETMLRFAGLVFNFNEVGNRLFRGSEARQVAPETKVSAKERRHPYRHEQQTEEQGESLISNGLGSIGAESQSERKSC